MDAMSGGGNLQEDLLEEDAKYTQVGACLLGGGVPLRLGVPQPLGDGGRGCARVHARWDQWVATVATCHRLAGWSAATSSYAAHEPLAATGLLGWAAACDAWVGT